MLSHTHRFLLVPSLALMALLVSCAGASEPKPTSEQIAQWVDQLGDNSFKVRESASKKLWLAGAAAESALENALKSDDKEVVRRASELLDNYRRGIYPDTPAEIAALIRAYPPRDNGMRMDILRKLLDGGDAGLRAILKIAAAEKDAAWRKEMDRLLLDKLPAAFLSAVTEEKFECFEPLLELVHEDKFVDTNRYAAYWLLRGKLTERIAHFAARLNQHPENKSTAQTLAYLHRANGDLVRARKAAEKSGDIDLLEGILYEMADWKALVEHCESKGVEKLAEKGVYRAGGVAIPAERWAYYAAYTRLAGKREGFDNAVRRLLKSSESDWRAFVAAKGLLLNDRPAEGLELLRAIPNRSALLFDILCARLEFAAAMEFAAKTVPIDKGIPLLGFARARQLCLLGDKHGEELFDRYAESIRDEVDPWWVRFLLREETRAGLQEKAFAHAAKAMSVEPPQRQRQFWERGGREQLYFECLFPEESTNAEVWWTVLRLGFRDESRETLLKCLRALVQGKAAAKDVKAWILHAVDFLQNAGVWKDSLPPRETCWQAVVESAILAGYDDLALEYLKKAEGDTALLHLGDLLAARKQWDKAAERYRQAWTKRLRPEGRDKWHDPLPLYLAGHALMRAGRDKEGEKMIERAHWVPFTDGWARYSFLRSLTQRGHKEAARREAELLLRIGEASISHSGDPLLLRTKAALESKDYLKAAEGFEKSMMQCFQLPIDFAENSAFTHVPARNHTVRARGLLAAGKVDEAIKHVELALMISPGYDNVAIALVPELERRGYIKESGALFNRCYAAYDRVCRDYPRCAVAHSEAAWLSACCRRNLDQALRHAGKAVELSPTHAGYLDTLAEVHFQRGDKEKAAALQKRAIVLEPKKAYYQTQLKRMEAGDPSAALPPHNDD